MNTKHLRYLSIAIVGCCLTAMAAMQASMWHRGRSWVLEDVRTPAIRNFSCVSIVLRGKDLDVRQALMDSLQRDTRIGPDYKGVIDSKGYAPLFFGVGYVKISMPARHFDAVASIVRTHMEGHFPDIHIELIRSELP
jgi:hypothetical protein